ncbi:MAG: DUF4185 domain-containing protein [Acholeplasmatales bacterium]|nr:MAG: DUF4185 domain-containing protein [Acholeplasmatales bacterium]
MPNYAIIIDLSLKKGEERTVDLGLFWPLGRIETTGDMTVEYQHLMVWEALDVPGDAEGITARYIKFTAKEPSHVIVYEGPGFVAEPEARWTEAFRRESGWMGGDGIFSFNLHGGIDAFNQHDAKTLFVFGDTLVGESDTSGTRRVRPLLMPNNSVAYLQGNGAEHLDIDFRLNTHPEGHVISFIEPDNPSMYDGTVPEHLIRDDHRGDIRHYVSGFDPKCLTLTFDLTYAQPVRKLSVVNYFDPQESDTEIMNRGIKHCTVSVSDSEAGPWQKVADVTLRKAENLQDYQDIEIDRTCRYIQLDIPPQNGLGNHYSAEDKKTRVFGLNQVCIYNDDRPLRDLKVTSSSVLSRERLTSWFWLQDGVVIDNRIYFLPLLVVPDASKPEGLQFDVRGISLIEAPIVDGEVDFRAHTQKDTPLYRYHEDTLWLFGAAILPNFAAAGAMAPDGYVYVYGYSTKGAHRALRVARVKPEAFHTIDRYEYYAEGEWVKDMLKASPLLEHISCEMSVTPIESGSLKGKVIAVFQYDVDSRYTAYSIGETPWGPFTKPRIVYACPEPDLLGGKAYTYNAKAHPHLSTPNTLLVSYNVNSYDMQQHFDNLDVYRPRFIRLKESGH